MNLLKSLHYELTICGTEASAKQVPSAECPDAEVSQQNRAPQKSLEAQGCLLSTGQTMSQSHSRAGKVDTPSYGAFWTKPWKDL